MICIFVLALLCPGQGSLAESRLTLPSALEVLDDECFQGCERIETVSVPDKVHYLGERAFANCYNLRWTAIPESINEIGKDCFAECGDALLVACGAGSVAHQFAMINGLDYNANTLCRALIVGQSYTGTSLALRGPANDARAMRFMLMNQSDRPFITTQGSDLPAQELLEKTAAVFASAKEQDISLFYYSGHGGLDGELVCVDGMSVKPAELREELDNVPGRKIVIIDACYSGQWINSAVASRSVQDFSSAFVSAFMGQKRSAGNGEYFIIASARSDEECMEMPITSDDQTKVMGCFTYYFCRGCGWDGVTSRLTEKEADGNGDGAVSIAEIFEYASEQALTVSPDQHAQTNAKTCWSFAPFR
ncbi:MAG: caspase family protein [Clostridia bacterium]|nr:caspase family protein [Clostridia bacterium]